MARKYHNLSGLVRDLEHAIEAGGVQEWDLLSRLDNALLAIEEADPRMDDESGDESPDDDADDRPDEGDRACVMGGRARNDELIERVGAQVPRGTDSTQAQRTLPGMASAVAPVDGMQRPVTYGARGDRRRGT